MKKIIFSICFIFFLKVANSQTVLLSYKNKMSTWSEYSSKWVDQETNFNDIKFVFSSTYIKVQDNANSIYRLITNGKKEVGDSYISYSWDAYDEKNRKCLVSMIDYGVSVEFFVVIVMYDDTLFTYYFRRSSNQSGYSPF